MTKWVLLSVEIYDTYLQKLNTIYQKYTPKKRFSPKNIIPRPQSNLRKQNKIANRLRGILSNRSDLEARLESLEERLRAKSRGEGGR